mgnify:CR=1 FL=1
MPYPSVEQLNKWITNAFKRLWAKGSATTALLILFELIFFLYSDLFESELEIQKSLLPKSGFATTSEPYKEAKLIRTQ